MQFNLFDHPHTFFIIEIILSKFKRLHFTLFDHIHIFFVIDSAQLHQSHTHREVVTLVQN